MRSCQHNNCESHTVPLEQGSRLFREHLRKRVEQCVRGLLNPGIGRVVPGADTPPARIAVNMQVSTKRSKVWLPPPPLKATTPTPSSPLAHMEGAERLDIQMHGLCRAINALCAQHRVQ